MLARIPSRPLCSLFLFEWKIPSKSTAPTNVVPFCPMATGDLDSASCILVGCFCFGVQRDTTPFRADKSVTNPHEAVCHIVAKISGQGWPFDVKSTCSGHGFLSISGAPGP